MNQHVFRSALCVLEGCFKILCSSTNQWRQRGSEEPQVISACTSSLFLWVSKGCVRMPLLFVNRAMFETLTSTCWADLGSIWGWASAAWAQCILVHVGTTITAVQEGKLRKNQLLLQYSTYWGMCCFSWLHLPSTLIEYLLKMWSISPLSLK